ncbi:MAG: hypothetical protein ACRD8Z_11470 [Nitrososphaeraceae archaeon]
MLITKQNIKRIKKKYPQNVVTNNRNQRKMVSVKSGKESMTIASLMGSILVFSMVATISMFEQQQAFAYGLLSEDASSSPSPSSASEATDGSSMKATTTATTPVSTASQDSMEQDMSPQSSSSLRSSPSIPQPNDNSTVVKVEATNALFEPAAGLTNVFGPEGLFPFQNFSCADALTCGISAGEEAKFTGVFEQGNANNMTSYEAIYTSPVTYGPHQIAGHEYKITLTDLNWNSADSALPTRQPEFAAMVNDVGFNQIQHGASNIDRSDVPQLYDEAFLYGHAMVTDITNGNNTVVAKDIFTHVMVAHVMDENEYYKNLKDKALSPNMVFLFAVNIPNDTELPGVGSLSAEQAQSFTPLADDESLDNSPPIDYPVNISTPREGEIDEPESQSTVWPVANPNQPLLFSFLVYQNADINLDSNATN